MKFKRYMVFTGTSDRGWFSFRGSFGSQTVAVLVAKSYNHDWWQVVDTQLEMIVEDQDGKGV